MSYYDPYENSNYYDPMNNTATGQAESAASGIASMATGLVKMAVVHTVARGIGKIAGGAISKGAANWAKKATPGTLGMSADKLKSIANARTFTQTLRASSKTFNKAYKNIQKSAAARNKILAARDNKLARLRNKAPMEASIKRFSSVFSDRKTFSAVAGRVIARDVLAGSLVGYAYDAASGQLGHMGVRDDLSAFNVPGHAVNYAKYMVKNAHQFAIMGNLKPLASGAGSLFGLGAKKALQGNTAFANKVFENVAKLRPANISASVRSSIRGKAVKGHISDFEKSINNSIVRRKAGQMTDAIGSTVETLNTSVRASFYNAFNSIGKPAGPGPKQAAGTKFMDSVNKAANQIRSNFAERQKNRQIQARSNLPGVDRLNVLSRLANGSTHAGFSEADQAKNMQNVLKLIGKDRVRPKQSVIGEILGATPLKIGDVTNRDYIQSLSDGLAKRFATGSSKPIMRAINNLSVGEMQYKRGPFNADLSYFSPKFMAKRALGAVAKINLNFAVPLPMMNKNMSIGAITGLDTVLADEYGATMYDTNLTGLGKIFRTHGGRKTLDDLLAENNMSSGQNNVSVAMSGRRLFAIEGHKIKELDTYDAIIKNTTPATSKGFSEVQKTEVNAYLYEGMHNPDPQKAEVFRRFRDAQARYNAPKNSIQRLLHKIGFDHRNIISQKWREVQDVLSMDIGPNGKLSTTTHKLYSSLAGVMTGKNASMDRLDDMVPVLSSVLKASEQDVSMILRKPGVAAAMGRDSMKYLKGRTDFLYNSQSMADLLDETMALGVGDSNSLWSRLTADKETKALFNTVLNNSSQATRHKHRERLGRFSDLTAIDSARVRFMEGASVHAMGEDGIHPFVSTAQTLLDQGLISRSEAAGMKMYGLTRQMFDEVKLSGTESMTGVKEKEAMYNVYKRHARKKFITQKEVIDYVSNPDLRPHHFKHTENVIRRKFGADPNELLDGFVGVKDHTNQIVISVLPGESDMIAGIKKVGDVGAQRLVNLVSDTTGLKFDPFKYGNGAIGAGKFVGKKLVQVGAVSLAYKTVDAAIASAPFYDDTALDEGITGVLADTTAKAHLMTSKILNATGVAGVGRHISGLMPGFNSTAMGGLWGVATNIANGPSRMISGAINGAIGARMLSAYMPDFTKTYEQLQAEYSGEQDVAIIKGKGWLLGTTPFQGNKVVGYKPNWYVEAKSRWKASETLYGSEFRKLLHEPIAGIGVSIGDFVDPYYMERQHFFTRPYHMTGGFQENMPLGMGTLASNTIGNILKPKKIMHSEFLHGTNESEQTQVSAAPIPNPREQLNYLHRTGTNNPRMGHNRPGYMGAMVYSTSRNYAQNMVDDYMAEMEGTMGLVGFASNTSRTALVDKARVFPTLETAGRITSSTRAYRDANLGGMGIYSEVIRRFIKKDNPRRFGVNNIPNMLPNWLPERFMTGDPYAKIIKGEIRLPGKAYELTHDVNFTLPGRASMLGAEEDEIVRYFTGFKTPLLQEELDILDTGTKFHENIQNWLKAEGLLISAENFVYDAKNNISGHIDGVIRDGHGGGGRRALEIKSISQEGLEKLKGPKNQHVGQLNFYLHEMNMQKGSILYVSRDNPSDFKIYEMDYNPDRYAADIRKIHKARAAASQMLAKGKQGMAKGFSYSWVDRMKILADVAPASKQWKEAKWVVQQQMSNGMLSDRDIQKYRMALKVRENVLRTYEMYPMRFKGQIMTPDAEYNRQSINENIKAAAEYSLPERIVGAAWETLTNSDTFITNKFFAYKDPMEHYMSNQVYGKEFTPWTDPYGSFIQPRINKAVGANSALSGGLALGADVGYQFGGFGMGLVGGAIGAMYGGVRGVTGSTYIPGKTQTERNINDYFDTLKYYKNARMESLSEGLEAERYRNSKNDTFFSMLNNNGKHRYTSIYRAAYDSERPYINAWLNETNPGKQREILNSIPERLAHTLQTHWKNQGSKIATRDFIDNTSADLASGAQTSAYSLQMLDPSVMDEDIKLKVINNQGLNAHDFGLGWGEQMLRIQDDMHNVPNADLDEYIRNTQTVSPGTIRSAIYNILNQHGVKGRVNVFVNNHVSDGDNKITLTLQHDRVQEIRDSVDFRERYM